MQIIILGISEHTTEESVREFIGDNVMAGWLMAPAEIDDYSTIVVRDALTDVIEYYGLVTINNDAIAKKVISKCNSQRLNGILVVVRQFFERGQVTHNRRSCTTVEIVNHSSHVSH